MLCIKLCIIRTFAYTCMHIADLKACTVKIFLQNSKSSEIISSWNYLTKIFFGIKI